MANQPKDPLGKSLLDDFAAFLGPELEDRPYRLGESPNSHSRWDETLILRGIADSRGFKASHFETDGVTARVDGARLQLLAEGLDARLSLPLAFEGLPALTKEEEASAETRIYQLDNEQPRPLFRLELLIISRTFLLSRLCEEAEAPKLAAAAVKAWVAEATKNSSVAGSPREKFQGERKGAVGKIPAASNGVAIKVPRLEGEGTSQAEVDALLGKTFGGKKS